MKSLTNDKTLSSTILKAFADNKFNIAKMMNSVFDRIQNFVGKVENGDYRHFFLFSTMPCIILNTNLIWVSSTLVICKCLQ